MKKAIKKILKFLLIFATILGISFSNGPFYVIDTAINSYISTRDIVDKAFNLSKDEDVVDKFNSYRNLAEGIKVQEARAAAGYIGNSNMIYTNGGAPGVITPNASTTDGDLLVFYHYSRATGGNEIVNLPAGFTPVFNSVTANYGLVAVGWRIKQPADGTFQATITNHTAGTSGETVIEFIQTYRGTDITSPIASYTASLSTWASSLNIGSVAAPAIATVNDGDMAVVFGGRFENVTGQTALTGNSLTWAVRTTANTALGTDAGAVVQTGLNSTGVSQTVTAKIITTTGTAQAGAGRMFIIKKQSNTAPVLTVSQPDGTGDTVNAGDLYNITYSLSDTEDVVTAAFYYDTDGVGLNGTAITGACAAAPEGTNVTCSWDTTGVAPGSYYVYGITNDGVNPQVSDYSPGMITINALVMDAISVSYEVGGDGARSGYSATITGLNFGTVANGSQANCSGGVGTGCIRFIVGGNTTVADADVTAWSNNSITFTVNANLASYGGLASLQVVSAGVSDSTPLDFYIYPNIISAPTNGQIGENITISGDHFGSAAGTIKINGVTVTPGGWTDTSITNVKIPGQTGIINGQIEVIRAVSIDNKNDLSNLAIFAPTVTSSSPASATTGQTNVSITFIGSGIDTDTGSPTVAPILKLTKGQPADCVASANCIIGTSYSVDIVYQQVSATFNLTGAATGYWKLVIINMDGQSGSFGDEVISGFNITALAPIVFGINPSSGINSGTTSNISIGGSNFQSDATVQLTKTAQLPIDPSTNFTYVDSSNLVGGAFNLTGKTTGWWNVVVTNVAQGTSGSYGNETNSGFQIMSSTPSDPTNLIQSKTQDGASIAVGGGIGGQTTIWFRMDMAGGKINEPYYPQVEVQPVGAPFECNDGSPTPCLVSTGFFAQGSGVMFNGTAVQGWVNINGLDGALYHWQARVRNSVGTSSWFSFGGNAEGETDIYIDNTAPTIDTTCATSTASITDLSATIRWNTTDATSGAEFPPNSGTWATAQVQYIKTSQYTNWGSTPGTLTSENPRVVSPHQVNLNGLSPSTAYTYRMRSKDAVGNEALSADCAFTTTSTRPIKTVEFFIGQEYLQNTGGQVEFPFTVTIPESPSPSNLSVKSAFIEVTGISSASVSKDIFVELRRTSGYVAQTIGYTIDSSSTTTPFTILFDALNPPGGSGNGQEDMRNIVTGVTPYNYYLYLRGGTVAEPISAFSAKLVITYSYEL